MIQKSFTACAAPYTSTMFAYPSLVDAPQVHSSNRHHTRCWYTNISEMLQRVKLIAATGVPGLVSSRLFHVIDRSCKLQCYSTPPSCMFLQARNFCKEGSHFRTYGGSCKGHEMMLLRVSRCPHIMEQLL